MDLTKIVVAEGQSGLYRFINQNKSGSILETLDGTEKKIVVRNGYKVSSLEEIQVFLETEKQTILLKEIFLILYEKYKKELPLPRKSSDKELKLFFEEFLPEYDKERVSLRDMKKIVNWYRILSEYAPELFVEPKNQKEENTKNESK
ncbi:MAG: DUF5606 domain-containing protein [Chitinophagaceae bacterium]|nr:DUF5606 domain-containing protein [Chitinophagaceae bacterium]